MRIIVDVMGGDNAPDAIALGAIEAAKEIRDVPVLFDIKVLPKSMTEGYGAWWRVGTPAVSEKEGNQKAYRDLLAHLETARKY